MKYMINDLTTDIDFATISTELSLEDRQEIVKTLYLLGYKKLDDIINFIEKQQAYAESMITNKINQKHQSTYFEGFKEALELIKNFLK